eukprot:5303937-Alexandrium_andersonii.AAC.1
MSASLVGSEMCIRDRHPPPAGDRGGRRLVLPAGGRHARAGGGGAPPGAGRGAAGDGPGLHRRALVRAPRRAPSPLGCRAPAPGRAAAPPGGCLLYTSPSPRD